MHSDVPASAILAALNRAARAHFIVNDDLDVYENYQKALEWLYANRPKRLPLIRGEYSCHSNSVYMSGYLPLLGKYWVQGDIDYNRAQDRYEHMVQDIDGRCYLLIA